MKKSTFKRLGLELLQHILAACIMAAVAGLLLNSYLTVDSIDGRKVYKIFPIDAGTEFEESEIYHDLFQNAVSDITQLVAIKGQLETNGILDLSKCFDVTKYAREIGVDSDCDITAVYTLDNLVKWGKYGVEFTDRFMSMSEFVHYFGDCIYPENFRIDEYGQLCFDDFYRVSASTGEEGEDAEESGNGTQTGSSGDQSGNGTQTGSGGGQSGNGTQTGSGAGQSGSGTQTGSGAGSSGSETSGSGAETAESLSGKSEEELKILSEKLKECTEDQLEDLVFSHIIGEDVSGIDMSREDDGSLTVYIPMLNCRYETVDGTRQLINCADNWIDYMQLQDNVVATINSLTLDYQRYQVCNEAYKEGNSNVKYMVRMMTDSGLCTYTNLPELKELGDNEVTESFNEFRRYLIYYPDSLVFMGNTIFGEEEIDNYIHMYGYAYPETTHIWLGVDSNYSAEGDSFYTANAVYQRIVPNINRIITMLAVLAVIWLGIGIYLTVTAGTGVGRDGNRTLYLNRFDRIWTELLLVLAVGLFYGGMRGYRLLTGSLETAGTAPTELFGIQITRLFRYGLFAFYGVYVSVSFQIIWYSFVRRVRAGTLWNDSFLYFVCAGIANSVRYVLRHRNSVVSILLPYNIFLFSNLAGIVIVYRFWGQQTYVFIVLAAMVAVDITVGILLFRYNAERVQIEEGINRIRDGEAEYKIDAEGFHGSGRELADAVNNIGEGIRKAVKTSMEDERMKADLITNVSHDIKTPLTSIINYVDLLKRLKIEDEPAKGYIDILDGKAQRLKQLTDDLVEVSKISSGNIELNNEKLNLTELLNQGIGEFIERMEECRLQMVFEEDAAPAYIYADSRRMWRVVENLFNNVCKYAMEGTRVYIDMAKKDGRVEVSIKNISSQQMNIRPEELTERFIRGDSSRTTEGSGLGLSIAKSLVQAQGGSFEILLDGDLFKVLLSFPEYGG